MPPSAPIQEDTPQPQADGAGQWHTIRAGSYGGSPPMDGWRIEIEEATLTIHAVSTKRDASLTLRVDRCLRVARDGIGALAVRLRRRPWDCSP